MYVRVKRAKITIFLHVDPTETVLELKQKIQAATDTDDEAGGVPVDRQRLLMGPTFGSVLEVRKRRGKKKKGISSSMIRICVRPHSSR